MVSIENKQYDDTEQTCEAIKVKEILSHQNQLKSSQFNDFLGNFGDKWVIVNHLSGGMIEADKDIYEALVHSKFDGMAQEDIDALLYGKFIVDYYVNEIEEFKNTKREWSEKAIVIGLQVIPTTFCNCRCPYCYEGLEEKKYTMTKEVMDQIINYVDKEVLPTTKRFNVSWYGGEPLLAMKQIEYLSEAFLELSQKKSIQYQGSLITNGYLLNPTNVDMLVKYKIDIIQVTLDGPKIIHDNKRVLQDGRGTWQTIIDNLKYPISKNIRITVRVNIDQMNIDHIDELFEELRQENVFDKINITFGVVQNFGNACKSIEDTILNLDEASKKIGQVAIKEKLRKSKNQPYRMRPNLISCIAVSDNSFIVGPLGELYRCTKTVGMIDEVFGHISKPDKMHPNYRKWDKVDNLDIETCRKCSMVVLCGGKECAFESVVKRKNIDQACERKFRNYYIENLKELFLKAREVRIQKT